MDDFRQILPTLLTGTAIAFLAACLIVAGLSLQSPVLVAILFIIGIVGGAGLAALGVLIDNSNAIRQQNQRMASNIQSFTRTSLEVLESIRDTTP